MKRKNIPGQIVLGSMLMMLTAFSAMAQDELWTLQIGSSQDERWPFTAPDGVGGVYVGGGTKGSLGGANAGDWDVWLARYDAAGNQLWVRQLGTSSEENLRSAAPDGSGGVYIGGTTSGSLGGPSAGGWDAWLARYDAAGNQLWTQQLGSSGGDSMWASAFDGSSGVYVGGGTYDPVVSEYRAVADRPERRAFPAW